jgi:hypothetical protein
MKIMRLRIKIGMKKNWVIKKDDEEGINKDKRERKNKLGRG